MRCRAALRNVAMLIERSCLPCDESARLHNERLCPCKVPADKNRRISAATWPDQFLVDALDGDFGVIGHRNFDILGNWKCNRMREAETQVEVRPLDGRSESDAFDFELLREPFADSLNHVVHETARKSVQRFHAARFCLAHERYTIVLRRSP